MNDVADERAGLRYAGLGRRLRAPAEARASMIVWSGHGYLVAVFGFLSSLLMELATKRLTGDDDFYQQAGWPLALALLIAGGLSFAVGTSLNGRAANDSGSDAKDPHRLFWLPMQWWGPIFGAIAVGVLVSRGM